MSTITDQPSSSKQPAEARPSPCVPPDEARRACRHPISRWYVCPAAGWFAAVLTPTRVRPVHLTLCGLALGALAAAVLVGAPHLAPLAGGLVLAAWFLDRTDGQLARRQNTVSAWGAWLDANVDELLDVGLHGALAAAAASQTGSNGPWLLLAAFLAGKYLFMHGVATEEQMAAEEQIAAEEQMAADSKGVPQQHGCLGSSAASPQKASTAGGLRPTTSHPPSPLQCPETPRAPRPAAGIARAVRAAYQLPGNADVRVHLLAAALLTGWLAVELAIVAAYYNVRWIVRYVLVARRLGGRR